MHAADKVISHQKKPIILNKHTVAFSRVQQALWSIPFPTSKYMTSFVYLTEDTKQGGVLVRELGYDSAHKLTWYPEPVPNQNRYALIQRQTIITLNAFT
jgi:hypothetical protein